MKKFVKNLLKLIIIIVLVGGGFVLAYNNRQYFLPTHTVKFSSNYETLSEYELKVLKFDKATLPIPTMEGYDFVGWYYGETLWSNDKRITKDIELVAKWAPKKYEITFIINDIPYTQIFEYNTMPAYQGSPSKPSNENIGYRFVGWQPNIEIVTQNATYTAVFEEYQLTYENQVNLNFMVDGMLLSQNEIIKEQGSIIQTPNINTTKYGMSGYNIIGWYTTPTMQTKANFPFTLNENTTLYGKWEYIVDGGFIPYLSKFNSKNKSTALNINSFNELVAWVEYLEFYNITEEYSIKLTYASLSGENLFNEFKKAVYASTYPSNPEMLLSSNSTSMGIIKSNFDRTIESNLLNADSHNLSTYAQQESALIKNVTPTRDNNFDNFNIKQVPNVISVSTSNQLVYALEKGLQPICETGSPAETVLNQAKQVLRTIITDNMTEYEKLEAIYNWLVLEVEYDNKAANTQSILEESIKYDAWYAEGVFNNGKAVCDGIAKAAIILIKLENIPVVRVTGNEHAWNKVYLNNNWYGFDATQGGILIQSSRIEIVSYTNFLFTDSWKTAQGYTSSDNNSITANTVFDYYDNTNITTNYDILINSNAEFVYLLQYIDSYSSSTKYFTVEIALANNVSLTTISLLASNNLTKSELNNTVYIADNVNNYSVYVLLFENT